MRDEQFAIFRRIDIDRPVREGDLDDLPRMALEDHPGALVIGQGTELGKKGAAKKCRYASDPKVTCRYDRRSGRAAAGDQLRDDYGTDERLIADEHDQRADFGLKSKRCDDAATNRTADAPGPVLVAGKMHPEIAHMFLDLRRLAAGDDYDR